MESLQAAEATPFGTLAPGSPEFSLFSSALDAQAPEPQVLKEKIPAAPDTDTSTKQTIQKMCEYRAAAAKDPVIQAWTKRAHEVYGQNSPDPRAKVWGVYWQVKHAVKFVSDEPRLFGVGEPAALDLLIAPAVLVRDKEPKGDCDDFTMLIQALLDQLGIESYTITVAADPSNPDRWSHVFSVAKLPDGTLCALDASHGEYPGWMVPREHIFRWQGWDSAGNTANVPIPEKKDGLHGYIPQRAKVLVMPRRGMGQCIDDNGIDVPCAGATPPIISPSPSGIPIDWGKIINNIISAGASVAKVAELPSGGYIQQTPYGSTISAGGFAPSFNLTGAFSSLASFLPWILIGIVGIAVVENMGGRRR